MDYPRMLYHFVEDPITVMSEEEENTYLEKGWERSPVVFNEIKLLEAKIAYYESEIVILKQNLEAFLTASHVEIKRKPGRPKAKVEV